jgi:hypothetical protein
VEWEVVVEEGEEGEEDGRAEHCDENCESVRA